MARPVSHEARAILDRLRALPAGEGLPVRAIAREVALPVERAKVLVHRMAERGEVAPVAVERMAHSRRPVTRYGAHRVEPVPSAGSGSIAEIDQVMRVGIVRL